MTIVVAVAKRVVEGRMGKSILSISPNNKGLRGGGGRKIGSTINTSHGGDEAINGGPNNGPKHRGKRILFTARATNTESQTDRNRCQEEGQERNPALGRRVGRRRVHQGGGGC